MKRKPKAPRARNHLVVHAIKRKAGAHRKSGKALRRNDQVDHLRGVAQLVQSTRLLTGLSSVRSRAPLPVHSRKPRWFTQVHCPNGGIGRRSGLKSRRRKVCWFEASLGYQVS